MSDDYLYQIQHHPIGTLHIIRCVNHHFVSDRSMADTTVCAADAMSDRRLRIFGICHPPGWTDGNHRARVDKFWCVNVNVLRALRVIDMVHVNLPNDWRESGLVGFQCAALKIRA